MKKVRIFALLTMLTSLFFLMNEQNIASPAANLCLPPDASCSSDFSCCSKHCCRENDPRYPCEFTTVPNTCV